MSAPTAPLKWLPLYAAFLVALVATSGALFVGEILGKAPCNLCWFQRAFMFPLAIVLAVAAYRSDAAAWVYALPLSVGGLAVSAYHTLLYSGFITPAIEPCGAGPSCSGDSMTILGGLPLPYLSLAAFAAISILLILQRRGATA